MEKIQFDNQLRRQCLDIPVMCETQIEGIKKGLEAVPGDLLKKIRKIYLTGCGDSYLAGIASVPVFKKYAGVFGSNFEAIRCIDAARYIEYGEGQEDTTLVIGISASGSPIRVMEALRRANSKGCHTLAVTNIPDSRAAKEAEYALIVNTPVFPEPGPGLRNYYASILGLSMLGVKLGISKGLIDASAMDVFCDAVKSYTEAYKQEFESIDSLMFETAVAWKDHIAAEVIGDGPLYSTAAFVGAKYVEAAGMMTNAIDSENWCHVNYFRHDPEKIGLIFIASANDKDHSRMIETMQQARKIGRPCVLIVDSTKDVYGAPDDVIVCEVPKTPKDFEILMPLLNFIPGTLLAAYVAALNNEVYFRGEDSLQKKSKIGSTIGNSKVEII